VGEVVDVVGQRLHGHVDHDVQDLPLGEPGAEELLHLILGTLPCSAATTWAKRRTASRHGSSSGLPSRSAVTVSLSIPDLKAVVECTAMQ
jgi:hypothetical protein